MANKSFLIHPKCARPCLGDTNYISIFNRRTLGISVSIQFLDIHLSIVVALAPKILTFDYSLIKSCELQRLWWCEGVKMRTRASDFKQPGALQDSIHYGTVSTTDGWFREGVRWDAIRPLGFPCMCCHKVLYALSSAGNIGLFSIQEKRRQCLYGCQN